MGRPRCTSLDDRVRRDDQIFLGHHDIGKCAVHHPADVLEAGERGFHRWRKVVLKSGRKEMVDAVYVVLIFEDLREFPNQLGISFDRVHFVLPAKLGNACIKALLTASAKLVKPPPCWPANALPLPTGRVQFGLNNSGPVEPLWNCTIAAPGAVQRRAIAMTSEKGATPWRRHSSASSELMTI
jgi:hypothetical protein